MSKVFIDTSFWLAFFLPDETHHTRCQLAFLDIKERRDIVFTSNFVVHETVTRLLTKTGWENCKNFMNFIDKLGAEGELVTLTVDPFIEEDAFSIFKKYHEHVFSFTDATIISLVKKYNISIVLTLDHGFNKIKLKTLPVDI